MMKSGLGIYAAQVGAVQCGAVVAVNALGDVIDYDDKHILAGLLTEDQTGFADTTQVMYDEIERNRALWGGNTTIGCVITNAKLDKTHLAKIRTGQSPGSLHRRRRHHLPDDHRRGGSRRGRRGRPDYRMHGPRHRPRRPPGRARLWLEGR